MAEKPLSRKGKLTSQRHNVSEIYYQGVLNFKSHDSDGNENVRIQKRVKRVGLLCEIKRLESFFLFQNLNGSLEFNPNTPTLEIVSKEAYSLAYK